MRRKVDGTLMIVSKVTFLCMGRLKEAYWRDAVAEYTKRLGAFCKLQIIEIEPERLPDAPSDTQIAAALEREGEKILSKIPAGAAVVALCIEGKTMPSEALADFVARTAGSGSSHLVFVIGSSYGLSDTVKRAASLRLSMSEMTFPHQLARVMLLEQLYRAMKILGGGTYHK